MPWKDKYRIYAELLQFNPSRRETSSSVVSRLQPYERTTAKEKYTSSEVILWADVLLQVHLTRAALRSCTASRHTRPESTCTVDMWVKLADPVQQHLPLQENERTGLSVHAPNSTDNNTLNIATSAIDHDNSTKLCQKKQNDGHYKNGT
jgi:hypothetical protein